MKVVVAAFNQEKALVGAFSLITNLRMEIFEALVLYLLGALLTAHRCWSPRMLGSPPGPCWRWCGGTCGPGPDRGQCAPCTAGSRSCYTCAQLRANIKILGLNGPSGPLKPRPCGLLRGFALSFHLPFLFSVCLFKSFLPFKSINSFNTFNNDDERKQTY